jgi:hypothetical protein
MPGKHHVGERLRFCVRLSPQVPAADEELARRHLKIDPDGGPKWRSDQWRTVANQAGAARPLTRPGLLAG